MRNLTQFGKRVMATMALIIAAAIIVVLGIFVLGNLAYRLHLNQQAFNVLAILVVLPICCMIISHNVFFLKDSSHD